MRTIRQHIGVGLMFVGLLTMAGPGHADQFAATEEKLATKFTNQKGWVVPTAQETELLRWVVFRSLTLSSSKQKFTETFIPWRVRHHTDGNIRQLIGYTETEIEFLYKNDDGQWKNDTNASKTISAFVTFAGAYTLTPQQSFAVAFDYTEKCEKIKKGLKKQKWWAAGQTNVLCDVEEYAQDSNGDLKKDGGLSETAVDAILHPEEDDGCKWTVDGETGEKYEECD